MSPPESSAALEAAIVLAREGFPVFPVYEIAANGCACGFACGRDAGKHPRTANGFKDATRDEATIRSWWTQWPNANVAIATGHELPGGGFLLVLDVDPRNGGTESFEELERVHGELPITRTHRTGGNGVHLFLRTATPVAKGKPRAGIDLQATGAYVIAPPSTHASGGIYSVCVDAPIAPAPSWLVSLAPLPRDTAASASAPTPVDVETSEGTRRLELGRVACETFPPSIEGENGSGALWNLALKLVRTYELPFAAAAELVETVYNPRCEPPWSASHIRHKLEDARDRSDLPCGIFSAGFLERMAGLAREEESFLQNLARGRDQEGDEPLGPQRCSDTGNAILFAHMHREQVRFVPKWDTWLVWDGARWRRDELNTVQELTRAVSVVRWDEVAAMGNPEEGESKSKRARWALATESKRGRDNMLALAQSVPGIGVSHETLDGDPWLLNVENGTLDLRTGVLRDHARADHLTKLSPVAYDASAACPTWDRFLERVTGGNVELASFLARAVGYSLTGDVGEQVVFFLQGAGANGKSTFTKILRELLGDYGTQAAPDLLLAKHGEAHPTEIADLHGARFALCQEVEQGRAWAEATLKQITGRDRVKARRMRENFWEFEPTHKLWVCANHRPRVRGADEGIWRRIKLVPFAVTIPEGERDRTLLEKLRAELPGILAWAVRGCLAWQRDGLGVPEEIREATAAYRLAEDQIESFIEDACETGPGFEAPKTPLYEAFRRWLLASGEPIIDAKEFRARMLAKGFAENRTKSARVWCGVRVRDSAGRFGMATG